MAATIAAQADRHHAVPHVEIDIDHVGVVPERAHVGADVEHAGRPRRKSLQRCVSGWLPTRGRPGRTGHGSHCRPRRRSASAVCRAASSATSPTTTRQPSSPSRPAVAAPIPLPPPTTTTTLSLNPRSPIGASLTPLQVGQRNAGGVGAAHAVGAGARRGGRRADVHAGYAERCTATAWFADRRPAGGYPWRRS